MFPATEWQHCATGEHPTLGVLAKWPQGKAPALSVTLLEVIWCLGWLRYHCAVTIYRKILWWKADLRQMLYIHTQLRESIFLPISKTFCAGALMSPDKFLSSALHFSWHLQHVPLWKKASTSLKWHLGSEWDILYRHSTVQMGTNISSSFIEKINQLMK